MHASPSVQGKRENRPDLYLTRYEELLFISKKSIKEISPNLRETIFKRATYAGAITRVLEPRS